MPRSRSKVKVTRPLYSLAVCSAARGASAPTGGGGAGTYRGGRPPTACLVWQHWVTLQWHCCQNVNDFDSDSLLSSTVVSIFLLWNEQNAVACLQCKHCVRVPPVACLPTFVPCVSNIPPITWLEDIFMIFDTLNSERFSFQIHVQFHTLPSLCAYTTLRIQ